MSASGSTTAGETSRRTFLKIGSGVVIGAAVAAAGTYAALGGGPKTTTETTTTTSQGPGSTTTVTSTGPGATTTLTSTGAGSTVTCTVTGSASTITDTTTVTQTSSTSSTSTQTSPNQVFLTLSVAEQSELAAIVEAIIPSDSNGPGAKEAGVIYFIDQQLKGEYGVDGNVYTAGPFVPANTAGPITVNGVSYSAGTANVRVGAGTRYQYPLQKRDFWRVALAGIQTYSNAAYGGNFESLSAANQTQVLTDLWNNKPTSAQFNGILPSDFAYELFFLTWSGFLMDPVYGGNVNMVGWTYTGFNGVNQGNFFGEGYTTQQLMLSTTPVPLKPVSLAMFQAGQ